MSSPRLEKENEKPWREAVALRELMIQLRADVTINDP
jgi:hypothetical protein